MSINSEQAGSIPAREPNWPIVVGSILPAGWLALTSTWIFHSNKSDLVTVLLAALSLYGIAYAIAGFMVHLPLMWWRGRRGFLRSVKITTSFRSWVHSGFIVTLFGSILLLDKIGWYAGWHGWGVLLASCAVGVLCGAAVIELAHKIHVGKLVFGLLVVAEVFSFALGGVFIYAGALAYDRAQHGFAGAQMVQQVEKVDKTELVNDFEDEIDKTVHPAATAWQRHEDQEKARAAAERDPFSPLGQKLSNYRESVLKQLAHEWGDTMTGVRVSFTINKNGSTRDVNISNSSNDPKVDNRARTLITNTQFPAVPDELGDHYSIESDGVDLDAISHTYK